MKRMIPILLAVCAINSAHAESAAEFPNRPVKLIVPFTPGGPSDGLARLLASRMAKKLGQQVVVLNVAGAAGTIGTQQAADSPADGYTVLLGSSGTNTLAPFLYKNIRYKDSSFSPIANVAYLTNFLVVGNSEKMRNVKNVADLLQVAKTAPDGITFGTPGNGTPIHLGAERLAREKSIKITPVAYRGSGPAMLALVGGEVDAMVSDPVSAIPQLRADKIRALAYMGPKRNSLFPAVPTAAETGMNFTTRVWFGILGPAGIPEEVAAKLADAIQASTMDPDVKSSIESMGGEVAGEVLNDFRMVLNREAASWGKVIAENKITLD